MKTLSMDLRERILDAYDHDEGTREDIAHRFRVSLGMVKKLLQQRRKLGDIGPLHHRCGRKPMILASHRQRMQEILGEKPDATLRELREELGLVCTLPAIHYALADLGLTYKKRLSTPANRTGPMLSKNANSGSNTKRLSTRRGSSFSMNRRQKPT